MIDFDALREMTNLPLVTLAYQDEEHLETSLQSQSSIIVIGGCLACAVAERLGQDHLLVLPGPDAIFHAIEEAIELAQALGQEKEKRRLFEAVFQYAPNGILVIDRLSKIASLNPHGAKQLGIIAQDVVGQDLESLSENLSKIAGSHQCLGVATTIGSRAFVVDWLPFEKGNQGVFIFQSLSKTVEIEQGMRRKHREQGWIAKATFAEIIGECKALKMEIKRAQLYAQSDSNILIYGETGVGKELFAQSIHRHSPRHHGPFVAINCAAIPEALMESELFGYEEGAFTGSKKGGKKGLFEMAHGGTLFLDEIGEINLSVQARLLRVIQEKEVVRVGGEGVIFVDVRIITATNVSLERRIPKEFREDLYYRLDVLHLRIPALRERGGDLLMLFQWFLKKRASHPAIWKYMTEPFVFILQTYAWPGNIRELQSVVERFAIQSNQLVTVHQTIVCDLLVDAIGADRLCRDIFKQNAFDGSSDKKTMATMAKLIEKIFPARKAFVAEKLGISRTTLWRLTHSQRECD